MLSWFVRWWREWWGWWCGDAGDDCHETEGAFLHGRSRAAGRASKLIQGGMQAKGLHPRPWRQPHPAPRPPPLRRSRRRTPARRAAPCPPARTTCAWRGRRWQAWAAQVGVGGTGGCGQQVGAGGRWVRAAGGCGQQVGVGSRWVRAAGGCGGAAACAPPLQALLPAPRCLLPPAAGDGRQAIAEASAPTFTRIAQLTCLGLPIPDLNAALLPKRCASAPSRH